MAGLRLSIVGQFLRFGVVGALGLIVDVALTLLLQRSMGLPPAGARPPAIAAAMLLAWWLNRDFSFRADSSAGSLGPYVVVATLAALLNYMLFLACLRLGLSTGAAILAATAVSMLFSFLGYRRFVFRSQLRDARRGSGRPESRQA